jgi:hypothetical protein
MKKSQFFPAGAAAIALVVGTYGIARASSVGKIYGTWVPVRYTPNTNLPAGIELCNAKMIFTPNTQSVWLGIHPDWQVIPLPVSYLDQPDGKVGVSGNTGTLVSYNFIDNNHIVNPVDALQCVYERQ